MDLSFNPQKDVNSTLMKNIGMCLKLKTLILTGCENINDEGINNLIFGDKTIKTTEGLVDL